MRLLLTLALAVGLSAQTMVETRPRLMVDATRIAALQARLTATAEDTALWSTLKTRYYTYRETDSVYALGQWGDMAALFALVDPDGGPTGFTRTNAQRACDALEYNLTTGELKNNPTGDLIRGPWSRALLIYDWAYSACSADQRAYFEARFDAYLPLVLAHADYTAGAVSASGNHQVGAQKWVAWYAIVRGNATVLANVYNAKLLTTIAAYADTAADALNKTAYAGINYEGIEYTPESMYMLHDIAEGIRYGTTDWDIWPNLLPVAQYFPDAMLAQTEPKSSWTAANGMAVFGPWWLREQQVYHTSYGVNWRSFSFYDRMAMNSVRYTANRLGYTNAAARAQYWLTTKRPCSQTANGTHCIDERGALQEWLYGDLQATATAPTDFWWAGPTRMFAKSDATSTGATWVGIYGGGVSTSGGHNHSDTGLVQIYRGGEWLTKKVLGYAGWSYPAARFAYADGSGGVMVNGHDAVPEAGGVAIASIGRFSRTPTGYRASCSTNACYAQVDAGTYRWTEWLVTPTIDQYYRDFLYLKNADVVAVWDRIKHVTGLDGVSVVYWRDGGLGSLQPTLAGDVGTFGTNAQRMTISMFGSSTLATAVRQYGGAHITFARKVSNDSVVVYFDSGGIILPGGRFTITGVTGNWSALNGTWTAVADGQTQTSPYSDYRRYTNRRLRITSTGAFAGVTEAWDYTQIGQHMLTFPWTVSSVTLPTTSTARVYTDENPYWATSGLGAYYASFIPLSLTGATGSYSVLNGRQCIPGVWSSGSFTCSYGISHGLSGTVTGTVGIQNVANTAENSTYYTPYRMEATLAQANQQAYLSMIDLFDSTGEAVTMTSRGTSNVLAASFTKSDVTYVVAAPQHTTPVLPLVYSVPAGDATNYVVGLTPDTDYDMSVSDNVVTISASGTGTTVHTDAYGVVTFNSSGTATPLTIDAPTSLASAVEDEVYGPVTVTIAGGTAPYSCTWTGLPSGVTGTACTSLGGTPSIGSAGDYTPRLTVTDDASGSVVRDYTLHVAAVSTPLTISPSTLPSCTYGGSYSATISASGGTGGPYTYSTEDTLPTGLSLSSSGVMSGTCSAAGSWTFEVAADDGDVTGTKEYTVVVSPVEGAVTTLYAAAGPTSAVIRGNTPYGYANGSCTATATGAAGDTYTATVAVGPPVRTYVITGLGANGPETYTYRVVCGNYSSTQGAFTTPDAGTAAVVFRAGPAPTPATHLTIEYGATASLGSTSDNTSCASGCTITLSGLSRGPLYYRRVWSDSGGTPIRNSGITVTVVQ